MEAANECPARANPLSRAETDDPQNKLILSLWLVGGLLSMQLDDFLANTLLGGSYPAKGRNH